MPGVSYTLGIQNQTAISGLKAFEGAMQGLQGVAGKLAAGLSLVGISFGAFKSADAFTDKLKEVFDAGKQLAVTRNITGQSITDLVTLRKAFTDVGLSADMVSDTQIKLQKALGGVNDEGIPTGKIFAQLGLSINNLKVASGVAQMEQVGKAISALPSQADRAFAAMQIFGREGAQLNALFSDSHAIEDARRSMAGYASIMERNANLFKSITNTLESLHGKIKGFFVGFADQIGPVLLPLLQNLKNSLNLTGLGETAGKEIAKIAQTLYGVFKNGDLVEFVGLSLRLGFDAAVKWLQQSLRKVLGWLGDNGGSELQKWMAAITDILQAIGGLGDILAGTIEKGIAKALRDVKVGGVQIFGDAGLNDLNTEGNRNQDEGAASVKSALADARGTLAEGFVSGAEKFGRAFTVANEDAKKRWDELAGAATKTALALGVGARPAPAPQKRDQEATISRQVQLPKIEPLTDRLAKVGLFIGGNSASKADQFARLTARNTELMLRLNQQMVDEQRKTNQSIERGSGRF